MTEAAVMTSADDFAVVIGLSRYPSFGELVGPDQCVRDVALWLNEEAGGGVPRDQTTLLGDDPDQTRLLNKSALQQAFQQVMDGVVSRGGSARRLYIYMAGLAARVGDLDHAFLLPKASVQAPEHSISPRDYADYFRRSGYFREIVLFVDCDVYPLLRLSPGVTSAPPWRAALPRDREFESSYFFGFATEGRFIGPWPAEVPREAPSGAFTRVLLEGLRGAAAGTDGVVTSETLKSVVVSRLEQVPGQRTHPTFESNTTTVPMVLARVAQTSTAATPAESPAQEKAAPEGVAAHQDDPALVDALSRRPFADVIGARIDQVRADGTAKSHGAFIINLHGPWGAGKTSVLNFLREYLQCEQRALERRWIVVEFNAWQHQRLQPPWWMLIHEIYIQSLKQLRVLPALRPRIRRLFWRLRMDWLPSAIAGVLVIFAVLASTGVITIVPPLPTDPKEANGFWKSVELGLKMWPALAAAVAVLYAFIRSMVFGSAKAAQVYLDMRSDPLRRVVSLYQSLIRAIGRPVIVFVDDLDRCDTNYVVELLEGIQTLFRSAPVTYVVAADRKWISSCFELKFTAFGDSLGEAGRPLGYLFLDKLFQLSVGLPRVSSTAQRLFWNGLLRVGGSPDGAHVESRLQAAAPAAVEMVKDVFTQEALEAKIAEVAGDPIREQAVRTAAALQITSPRAQRETEHWLQPFLTLLEPNPRSMKRLLNAYGVHQATQLLDPRAVPKEAMVRWTIVELRWPVLADYLTAHPEAVDALAKVPGDPAVQTLIPTLLQPLCGNADVKAVLAGGPKSGFLNESSIRQIVGLDPKAAA